MSVRSVSALALGVLLVLAGCSDDGEPSSDGATTQEDSSSTPSGPTFTNFADFPGDELMYFQNGVPTVAGLRLKAVDAVWQVELADEVAAAGTHFLVVYVAVTGEMVDRSVADARMYTTDFTLSLDATVVDPEHATTLEQVPDGEWRDYRWQFGDTPMAVDIAPGTTMISAVAFPVPDETPDPGALEFCAKDKDASMDNCVTVALPAEPR